MAIYLHQISNHHSALVSILEELVVLLIIVPGDLAAGLVVGRDVCKHGRAVLFTNLVLAIEWRRDWVGQR